MKRTLSLVLVILIVSVMPVAAQAPDPRTDNARAFHVNGNGQVDGVELVYQERPWTSYQLVQARLVDEASAAGNIVAKYVVVDCYGTPISENVYLAWPWPGMEDGATLPGNQNNEHMVYSTYKPPEIGPLALFVGDSKGRINSDVIGGIGLPFNRHVSFFFAFRKRCGVQSPVATVTPPVATVTPPAATAVPPTVTPPLVTGDLAQTNSLLQQLLEVFTALARHFGVPEYATQ